MTRGTHSLRGSIAVAAFIASVAICMYFVLAGKAGAHDALPSATQPLGWQYGWECCNLLDCRQISHAAVTETPQGYRIEHTGELIPYGDKRLKRSRDEFFHQCQPGGNVDALRSICLYIPDQGF